MSERTLVLALHGNPGSPGDFSALESALGLPPAFEFKRLAYPDNPLTIGELLLPIDKAVAPGTFDKLVLIGFSFGAYVAATWVRKRGGTNAKSPILVLINPSLAPKKRLPAVLLYALEISAIRNFAAAFRGRKRAEAFINGMFAPEIPDDRLQEQLLSTLADPRPWMKAICLRLLQDAEPLSNLERLDAGKLVVIYGRDDGCVPWSSQRDTILRTGEKLTLHEVCNAGHALIWTRPEEVASHIRQELGIA